MKLFFSLIRKEALVEFRAKELLVYLGGLSILFSLVISLGVEGAFIHPESVQKIFPSLVWLAFLCSATVAVGRTMDYELRGGAITGLITGGVPLETLYCAKVVSLSVILSVVYFAVSTVIAGLLSVPVADSLPLLMMAAFPSIISFSALALVISAITEGGRGRSLLLPILLLPLLVPMFAIGLENSHQIYTQHTALNEVSGFISSWLMALLYVLVGIGLFPRVIRD